MGHGSTAADGMAHADLSGGPSFLGGATPYCAWAGDGVACPTNDGGRASVLRYDTPAIGPASIAISTGNDDYWDVKLKILGLHGRRRLRPPHRPHRRVRLDERDAGAATCRRCYRVSMGPPLQLLAGVRGYPSGSRTNQAARSHTQVGVKRGNRYRRRRAGRLAEHAWRRRRRQHRLRPTRSTPGQSWGFATYRKTVTTPAVPAATNEEKRGDITTASAAFSFGQGTSVALAWSQNNATDNEYQYLKLDHSYADGASVAVYYKTGETGDTDGSMIGVGPRPHHRWRGHRIRRLPEAVGGQR